jgi:3-oxoacyl-[acyl-carrier protein] reductase
MKELLGRKCLVTGASRGFGAALARAFWNEGADLLLVARNGDHLRALIESFPSHEGQTAMPLTADLGEHDAPDAIARAVDRFGGVDVIVNNAAIQGPIGPLWCNDANEWQRTIAVNLLAPAAVCRLLIPVLQRRGGGSIVNLSGGGAAGPRPNFTAYAASKAALVRFSETLADEVRPLNINVNCVAPGAMATSMMDDIAAAGEAAGAREREMVEKVRRGGAESMAAAVALVLFLASRRASAITGKLISAVWDPWNELVDRVHDLRQTDVYTLRRIVPADRQLRWDVR